MSDTPTPGKYTLILVTELDRLSAEVAALRADAERQLGILARCRTVLGNMALENEGAIFNRWPISHEPLRGDARNLLPLIDVLLDARAALAAQEPTAQEQKR